MSLSQSVLPVAMPARISVIGPGRSKFDLLESLRLNAAPDGLTARRFAGYFVAADLYTTDCDTIFSESLKPPVGVTQVCQQSVCPSSVSRQSLMLFLTDQPSLVDMTTLILGIYDGVQSNQCISHQTMTRLSFTDRAYGRECESYS